MKTMKYFSGLLFILLATILLTSCESEESDAVLQNKCLHRSLGPNVCGNEIEFAYAMAIKPGFGKLIRAEVEATIAGAAETWLEHHSYHTQNGVDIGVVVGNPSENIDNRTHVEFITDTCAATLRYYYVIPEAAKGKSVSFTFSAQASNGETVSLKMGPYEIARMDMELDLAISTDRCYISIEDMAVYTAEEAALIPDKIDLVYLYRNYNSDEVEFNHAFAAPAADRSKYLPGITLPEGVTRDTRIRDVGIKDAHLARLHLKEPAEAQPAIYLDDIDLRDMDMSTMPNWALDIITNDGMFIETEDGKYKAYIYANEMRRGRAGGTISMKRYTVY